MNGIKGETEGKFIFEIHRNGYISALFFILPDDGPHGYKAPLILIGDIYSLFQSFLDYCSDLIKVASFDYPYFLRCRILNSESTYLYNPQNNIKRYSGPLKKRRVLFSDPIRQPGEDFRKYIQVWNENLFNAFGLRAPK